MFAATKRFLGFQGKSKEDADEQQKFVADLENKPKVIDDSLRIQGTDSDSSSESSDDSSSESSSDQESKDSPSNFLAAVSNQKHKDAQALAAQTQQKLNLQDSQSMLDPNLTEQLRQRLNKAKNASATLAKGKSPKPATPIASQQKQLPKQGQQSQSQTSFFIDGLFPQTSQSQVGKQVAKNPQIQKHLDEAVAKQQQIQQNAQQVVQVANQMKQDANVDPAIKDKVTEQAEVLVAIQNIGQKQVDKIANTESEADAKQAQKKIDDLKGMTDITVQQAQQAAQKVQSSQTKGRQSQLPSTQPHSESSSPAPEQVLADNRSTKKDTEPSSVDTTESYNSSQEVAKQVVVSGSKYDKEVDTRITVPIVDQIFNNLVMWLPVDDRDDSSAGDIVVSIGKDVQTAHERLTNLQEAGIVSGIPAVADIQMLTEVTQTLYAQRTGKTLGI